MSLLSSTDFRSDWIADVSNILSYRTKPRIKLTSLTVSPLAVLHRQTQLFPKLPHCSLAARPL